MCPPTALRHLTLPQICTSVCSIRLRTGPQSIASTLLTLCLVPASFDTLNPHLPPHPVPTNSTLQRSSLKTHQPVDQAVSNGIKDFQALRTPADLHHRIVKGRFSAGTELFVSPSKSAGCKCHAESHPQNADLVALVSIGMRFATIPDPPQAGLWNSPSQPPTVIT